MSNQSVKEPRHSYLAAAANELAGSASKSSFDAATFFEKFELLADVANAIPRLREIILELAIRGELVPQFDDKPCVSFDCEIAKNKQPHPIPETWRWVTFADAANIEMGNSPPGDSYNDMGNGTPLINGPVEFSHGPFGLTRRIKFTTSPTRMCKEGDLLICVRGSTTGRTNIAAFDACIGRGVAAISPKVVDRYVHLVVLSMRSHIFDSGKGSTFKSITQVQLRAYPIPLPPLAEQKRIVAKVDELMGFCDRLDALEAERKERHASLSRAALARFAASPTPANLHFLFHNSFDVDPNELRSTIVEMAVRGTLLPQFENDETACELLKKVIATKAAHGAKDTFAIQFDDVPFEIPSTWIWTTLGCISLSSDSGWSPQCESRRREKDEWGVLKVSAVTWGEFRPDENKALRPGFEPKVECEVHDGDFLLSRANTEALVARSVVVQNSPRRLMMSDKIVRFTFPVDIDKHFINIVNSARASRHYYATNASGTSSSMKNVSRSVMNQLPIPLPPLAEQKRIVAKVVELMALVDQLEQQLAHSRTLGQQLLEAVVARLTSPDESEAVEAV